MEDFASLCIVFVYGSLMLFDRSALGSPYCTHAIKIGLKVSNSESMLYNFCRLYFSLGPLRSVMIFRVLKTLTFRNILLSIV